MTHAYLYEGESHRVTRTRFGFCRIRLPGQGPFSCPCRALARQTKSGLKCVYTNIYIYVNNSCYYIYIYIFMLQTITAYTHFDTYVYALIHAQCTYISIPNLYINLGWRWQCVCSRNMQNAAWNILGGPTCDCGRGWALCTTTTQRSKQSLGHEWTSFFGIQPMPINGYSRDSF